MNELLIQVILIKTFKLVQILLSRYEHFEISTSDH